jgi:hypothetical protein
VKRAKGHLWRTRGARLVSMVVVGYILFAWVADLRSEQTEAWLTAGGTHGTWAAVFVMGLAIGGILGALCGPVLIDLVQAALRPRENRPGQSR